MHNLSPKSKAYVAAGFTIFIWATTYISTKMLLVDFTATEITFFRFVIALAALFLMQPKGIPFQNLREELLFAGAGLSGVTLYFMLQNLSLTYTLASNAAVLVSVAPFFIAILSHFTLQGEPFRRQFFLGFLLAIAGIALISFNGNFILKLSPLGDVLALTSAIAWASYSIILKKLSAKGYPIVPFTRKIFFYGTLFLLPLLPLMDVRLGLDRFLQVPNLLNLLFLGLLASALCFVSWNFAVGVLGAVKTSVFIYLMPVITVFFSVLILREPLTWVAALGVALIIMGLAVSEGRLYGYKRHEGKNASQAGE